MNRTIKLLMLSDIFVLTGFGLIDPVLAIFITEGVSGGSLIAVGVAVMLFLIIKSFLQLPFSRYVDSHREKVLYLIIGACIIMVVPFIYSITTTIEGVYIAQSLRGIGAAMAYPTWLSLFSTHLDRKHEGFEWALYSTSVGIGTAIAGFVGASIVSIAGFPAAFTFAGILSIIGVAVLFGLERRKYLIKKIFPVHHKGKLVKTH